MTGTLPYALKAAARGLLVFPLRAGSKQEYPKGHPLDRSHATTDPDKIRAMWAMAGEFANIGIIVPPGWIVADVDEEDRPHFKHDLSNTLADSTQDKGFRAFYKLPAGMDCPSHIDRGPGQPFEVFGPWGRVVGEGSRTRKGEYVCINDLPPAPIPGWLVEAVEAYNAANAAKRAAAAERLATMPTGQPILPDGRRKAYAEAVLVKAVDQLRRIPDTHGQGRTAKLLSAALRVGSHLHLGLNAGAAASMLANACEHWHTRKRNADLKAIEKGITKGAKSPHTPAWKEFGREINHANTIMANYVATAKAGGKVGTPGQTVRATSATAVLGAMVGHTCKHSLAGAFIMSVREIAEAIGTSHPAVIRALNALKAEGILQRVDRKEAAYIRANDANGVKLHDRQLAAAYAFDALTVLALVPGLKVCELIPVIEYQGKGGALSSDTPTLVSIRTPLHTFSFAGLGRSAGAVVNAIAQGARTSDAIEAATGLHRTTVSRALDRLAQYHFVLVVDDGLTMVSAAELAAAAADVHLAKGLAGRAFARAQRHADDRRKQERWLSWREAEKAAGRDYSFKTWKALQTPAPVLPKPAEVATGSETELPAFITTLIEGTLERLPSIDPETSTALFTGHYRKLTHRADLQRS